MAKKRNKKLPKRTKSSRAAGPEPIPVPDTLPVLAAKDMVPFPGVMMSLYLSRPASIRAMEAAMSGDRLAFIVAQENPDIEDPKARDLYKVGVVAHVVRTLQVSDGRYKVLLQGLVRAKARKYEMKQRFLVTKISPLPAPPVRKLSADNQAIMNRIRENLQVLVEYEHLPEEMLIVTEEVHDPGVLSDVILAHYKIDLQDAQAALEELDPLKRLRLTDAAITDDLNKFILTEKIKDKARDEMSKGQREYYLREQIKQIQRELGDVDVGSDDLAALRERLTALNLPSQAKEESFKQLKRLEHMSPESSEFALLRTYLEWITDLPWSTSTKDQLNLSAAKGILDEDHFGLDKVKDRILEYLSVRALNPRWSARSRKDIAW